MFIIFRLLAVIMMIIREILHLNLRISLRIVRTKQALLTQKQIKRQLLHPKRLQRMGEMLIQILLIKITARSQVRIRLRMAKMPKTRQKALTVRRIIRELDLSQLL